MASKGCRKPPIVANECEREAFDRAGGIEVLKDAASHGALVLGFKWRRWDKPTRILGSKELLHAALQWCHENNYPDLSGILDPDQVIISNERT